MRTVVLTLALWSLAVSVASSPAKAETAIEAFEAWREAEDLRPALVADALGDAGDTRARPWLQAWADRPGDEHAAARIAAQLALAKLSEPRCLEVSLVVALPTHDAREERRKLLKRAMAERLLDASARRQLRGWPGLQPRERINLALGAWRNERVIEDRAWLAEQLQKPDGDRVTAALLLHEASDARGTAFLTDMIAEAPIDEAAWRRRLGTAILIALEDFRSAAGLAMLVAREAEGSTELEIAARNGVYRFTIRSGTQGVVDDWLDGFAAAEPEDRKRWIGSAISSAGVTPARITKALIDSSDPDAQSIGTWLELVKHDHDPESHLWRDWFQTATASAHSGTILWLHDPSTLDVATERAIPAMLAWYLGNPEANETMQGMASKSITQWLMLDTGTRDVRLASWLEASKEPLSGQFSVHLAKLPSGRASRTKATLIHRPSFGHDDSAYRALIVTELSGGVVQAECVRGLKNLKEPKMLEEILRIRAAWWLAWHESDRTGDALRRVAQPLADSR